MTNIKNFFFLSLFLLTFFSACTKITGFYNLNPYDYINTNSGHDGVPSLSPDYSLSVEEWWAAHPFNEESTNFAPQIKNPLPVLDVRRDYGGSIESAISALPASGGTLYFMGGKYYTSGKGVEIWGKNNIHFVSDGHAVLINSTPEDAIIRLRACETWEQTYSTKECFSNPISNFHFKNITFDGQGSGRQACVIYGARDVVFDNCTFRDFIPHSEGGDAMVHSGAWADNIWFRNCSFTGQAGHAILLDGTHGSGMLNCRVDHYIYPTAVVFLCNDDCSRDIDNNGTWEGPEIRLGNYIACVGNEFGHEGDKNVMTFAVTAAHTLIKNNSTYDYGYNFVYWNDRPTIMGEAWTDGLNYSFFDLVVENNYTANVNYFLEILAHDSANANPPDQYSEIGHYKVISNTAPSVLGTEIYEREMDPSGHPIQGPNTVAGNSWQ